MEYHNTFSTDYLIALKGYRNVYKMKIEVLSDQETVIGEIVKSLSEVEGQITINYERITRRSCSLSIGNINGKFRPDKNSTFWYNRKFKLWLGLQVHNDTYWWSQGVFYTQSANMQDNKTIQIEAVDKGGALSGVLKIGMVDYQYVIPAKTKDLVLILKEILAMKIGRNDYFVRGQIRMGGDKVLDTKPPIIDTMYNNMIVQSEISIDADSYIGDIFTQFADLYNAEVYYDTEGHFKFVPVIEDECKAILWSYSNLQTSFEGVNYTYSFDGENVICVYTNTANAGVRNVSYTAYNTNPLSPINIDIGIRRAVSQEIPYYSYGEGESVVGEYKENVAAIQREMKEKHISENTTVFGNIDMDNRQVIVWTSENLTTYANAIQSWDLDPDELAGSISTVLGMSSEYDGVEIAFSPMLQSDSGAVLLDESTVSTYINTLINNAGEGWTKEDLLALDVTGVTINNVVINKLIADVGETAIATGEAMHYVGKYGALAMAKEELKEVTDFYNKINEEQMIKDCRSAANYYLRKNSMLGMQLAFNSPIIPHLDVNKAIEITDEYVNLDHEKFIIQSITIPFGSQAMSINATNVNWIPQSFEYGGVSGIVEEGS